MALIEFLKQGTLDAPRAVTTARADRVENAGFVTASFGEGEAILKDDHGDHFRLVWADSAVRQPDRTKDNAATDARRPLAPGSYSVVSYRIVRRDDQGTEWFISASGQPVGKLRVTSGAEVRLDIKAEISMECRVKSTGQGVNVQAMIAGAHKAGLTIYRDGTRVPMSYAIRDSDGREIASGPMGFG